jgi:hypothetical protein
MKMLDLKPYGAFIEHTIRPLFEESELLISALNKMNLKEGDVPRILTKIALLHLFSIIMETIKTITCVSIMGYVAWTISQS